MDISDQAEVLGRLQATSRWLHLVAGWLADQGTEVEAADLVDAARRTSPPYAVGYRSRRPR